MIILPIQMPFFESVSNFMYDISNNLAPTTIRDSFIKSKSVHSYNTRASSSDKFHIKHSRLTQQCNILLHVLEPKSGTVFHIKCIN